MQKPWRLRPSCGVTLVLLAVLFVRTVCASSDSYLLVFHTNAGRYEFEMVSLEIQGIQQRQFLSPDFKLQFQTVKDLTPEGVQSFLKRSPENRDAMVIYLLNLPSDLIRDAHRVKLLRTIEQFRVEPLRLPEIEVIRFNTTQLGGDDKTPPNASSPVTASAPITAENRQRSVSADLLSHPAHHRDSGFDFRFYRGLLVEYQFDAPALLRFDARRQRFELEWMLD